MIIFELNKCRQYRKDVFQNYRTSKYKLHYMETPTGVKIVLNTDLNVGNIDEILHNIYKVCLFYKYLQKKYV